MFRQLSRIAAGFVILCSSMTASAVVITVQVVDPTNILMTFSGALNGPTPTLNEGFLWIDTPVPGTVTSSGVITGDAMLGPHALHSVFSGYGNTPYDGTLQLRTSLNGILPMTVGDILSGSAAITFDSPHGMTQSMFDGAGVPIYWGRNGFPNVGTLQGYATSSVPEPAGIALLALGLIGARLVPRRKRAAIPA